MKSLNSPQYTICYFANRCNIFIIFLDMSSGKKGGAWTYKIYFAPEADKSSVALEIEDEKLNETLEKLVDVNEIVKRLWVYKHPLWSWQITEVLLYHMFVLFETQNWWWSIEKNSEGISFIVTTFNKTRSE